MPGTHDHEDYLPQEDAAAVCGKSYDTIRRYRRQGKLTKFRTRPDGVIEVAVADLVAAGLLNPLAAAGDVRETARNAGAERQVSKLRDEIDDAQTYIDWLVDRLAEAREEISFLRRIVEKGAA